jgi:glycosyltransferase involved in cell wall biosynthesis
VLFLSNLSPAKGYLDVIAAAANVVAVYPKVQFTIAGEWSGRTEAATAMGALSKLGLSGKLRFVPAVSGLRKYQVFREADIFVFPPRHLEGQPVVLLEAMSYGLPVITTPQGGIVDTVLPGETGLFVPPQDPDALAGAICTLVDDPGRRAAMGMAGRARYLKYFTESTFQRNLARVLRNAVDGASSPNLPSFPEQ